MIFIIEIIVFSSVGVATTMTLKALFSFLRERATRNKQLENDAFLLLREARSATKDNSLLLSRKIDDFLVFNKKRLSRNIISRLESRRDDLVIESDKS